MSDLERRLRAAMMAATERPPANLLQEVRRRHRRHVRRVSAGCAVVVAALAIAVPPVAHALRTGPRPQIHPAGPATTPTAPANSTGSCQPDASALTTTWRDGSLQAGPIWFAYARIQGYVHLSSAPDAPRSAHRGTGQLAVGVMIVEVDYGSRVVLTVDPGARSYFRLLNGFNDGSGPYPLSAGLTSLTLVSCPPGTPPGDNGPVSDYYLGFVIRIGSDAPADVSTSASTRPIRVLFTCLRPGCDT